MRLIAARAALAMLAGCSATTATSGPVVASPSPTSSSPSPTPSMTPTPTPSASKTATPTPVSSASAAASAYVAAQKATGQASGTDADILGLGQYYCEGLDQYYVQDPMQAVSALIENAWRRNALAIKYLCPQYAGALAVAATGFFDGTYDVTKNPSSDPSDSQIAPGTYKTIINDGANGIHDCYWERTTAGGKTIANDFVTYAPKGVTVTVKAGEGFVSDGCGAWLPA